MFPRTGSSSLHFPACIRVPDLKASPLERPAGRCLPWALSPARPLEAKAMDVTRTETFVSGALGAVMLAGGLVLAAALLLAPGAARAVNDCGALNSGNSFTENCPDAAYTGIVYWDQPNAVTLTVPGTATTATITAGANNGLHNGITIRTNDDTTSPRTSPVRNIALTVGGTGTFVAIVQSGTRASSWYNNRGIFVLQRDGGRRHDHAGHQRRRDDRDVDRQDGEPRHRGADVRERRRRRLRHQRGGDLLRGRGHLRRIHRRCRGHGHQQRRHRDGRPRHLRRPYGFRRCGHGHEQRRHHLGEHDERRGHLRQNDRQGRRQHGRGRRNHPFGPGPSRWLRAASASRRRWARPGRRATRATTTTSRP